jgi:hypothetical protein
MTWDTNFAPHIDKHNRYLTLATCKPHIRLRASKDDWVMGVSGKTMKNFHSGGIMYLMEVTRPPIDINSYWNDAELNGRDDNICHFEKGDWIQANHAPPDHDMKNDLSGKYVLLSEHFYFFGIRCPDLEGLGFPEFVPTWQDYKADFDEKRVKALVACIRSMYSLGVHGEHVHPPIPVTCHPKGVC